MTDAGKQFFSIADRRYELVEVDGPIRRGSKSFTAQFDHDAAVLRVSRTVPLGLRPILVANAVSDACFRLWRPVPVIWPNWMPSDRLGRGTLRRDPVDDPPNP